MKPEKSHVPVNVDFKSVVEWKNENEWDTLLLHLQGFTKDQLKVQITAASSLRISAARKLEGENTWIRFQDEIPINRELHDINKITARFENGILQIKLVKLQPARELKPIAVKKPSETTQQKSVSEIPQQNKELSATPAEARKPSPEQKDQPVKQLPATPAEARKPSPEQKNQPVKPLPATPADARKPSLEQKNQPVKQLPATPVKTPEPPAGAATEVAGTECQQPRGENVGDGTPAKPPELAATKKKACKSEEMNRDGVATKTDGCSRTTAKLDSGRFQQIVCGLSTEMKRPRAIMNLMLVIISMAVLWLYARNAIRLTGI